MNDEIDRVPLVGVDYVKPYEENETMEADTNELQDFYYFQIATNPDGYNSGRTYNLRTKSKAMHDEVVPLLSKFSEDAKRRALSSTMFRKSQLYVRTIYERTVCQSLIALIIVGVSTLT